MTVKSRNKLVAIEKLTEMKMTTPKGFVAVLVNESGREIATATDFDSFRTSGFKLKESQRIRVKRKLARAMIGTCCATYMEDVIDEYDASKIMDALVDKKNFKVVLVEVGYEDSEEDE